MHRKNQCIRKRLNKKSSNISLLSFTSHSIRILLPSYSNNIIIYRHENINAQVIFCIFRYTWTIPATWYNIHQDKKWISNKKNSFFVWMQFSVYISVIRKGMLSFNIINVFVFIFDIFCKRDLLFILLMKVWNCNKLKDFDFWKDMDNFICRKYITNESLIT